LSGICAFFRFLTLRLAHVARLRADDGSDVRLRVLAAKIAGMMRISLCFQGLFASRKRFPRLACTFIQEHSNVFHISCVASLCTIAKESLNLSQWQRG
jgi:hypothetical protein